MTDTANLGLPFIEGSQAQKHVTHNEALRILDAAIQIAVLDLTRTTPPTSPADGERHVAASGATGAWSGQANAIATWQDGAWAFLAPHTGWCIWSVADDVMFVFDGTHWRDLRDLPVTMDNAVHVGINTTASSPNLLSVKSNAALLSAINVADGGSGDARLQISKESSAKTASVFFSDAFSGRAEFGLSGSDAFKLKVSPDGSAWVDAFSIDQSSGNLTLARSVAFAGIVAPPQITANQNDYNPTGLSSASVLRLSTDASRQLTGIAAATDGRLLALRNVGAFDLVLKDVSTSSTAANRFAIGADLTMRAGQGATLLYDVTLSRWLMLSQSGAAVRSPTAQVFSSGSGTYTTPSGCTRIRVRMAGGGAGGSGSGTTCPNGSAGGATTFGTMTAGGAGATSGLAGGAGGTCSGILGTQISALTGAFGNDAVFGSQLHGGEGGSSSRGGRGKAGPLSSTGGGAQSNTGSGGGGAGATYVNSATSAGGGGGAGAEIETIINSPAATYSYAVGAGGSAGAAGASGNAGGAGAGGYLVVEEYYGV